MNVIENILTTRPYKHIKAVLEIKKALGELQNIELDFNDKNIAFTYKKIIEDRLRESVKDLSFNISFDRKTSITTNNIWERILNTEPLTTVPSRRNSNNLWNNAWNFDIDVANGPDRGVTTITNGNDLRQLYGNPESSSAITLQDGTINLGEITATFTDRDIGTLEPITYISSRSNAEQN